MAEHLIRRCAIYTRKSPKKDWNRTTTRCMHNAMPARRSSKARAERAGDSSKQPTTMAVSPAARWKGRRYSNFSQPFAKDSSTWWWSTKSTGSRVHWPTLRA